MIWLIIIFLTCIAVLSVLLPLALDRASYSKDCPKELVYGQSRGQIDKDVEIGLLDWNDARAMIASRVLYQQEKRQLGATSGLPRTFAALTSTVLIPAVSISIYLHIGHHEAVDQPLAARIALLPGHKDSEMRVAELEAFLANHPSDGRAYELIAPFYLGRHQAEDAVHALEKAVRLLGPSADRLSALGEARFLAAEGIVTDEARKDFEAVISFDPHDTTSRYYLGLAAAQRGDAAKAAEMWSRLLADAPTGANWLARLRDQLAELESPREKPIVSPGVTVK